MNSIFVCVFCQEKYVDMFFLLLKSLIPCMDSNTMRVIVYTSTRFRNRIQQSPLYQPDLIMFEINDAYETVDLACKARLDLFKLESTSLFEKVLYLDTDVIVKGDLNTVFDICQQDVLYALEEGFIDSDGFPYHGRPYFQGKFDYPDKSAFCTGVLLMKNCSKIKFLFNKIHEHMATHESYFMDQPHIVYISFIYRMFNNKSLKKVVINNDDNVSSQMIIHHFPGGPGKYQHKLEIMSDFLKRLLT